jgi:hypothetical protein
LRYEHPFNNIIHSNTFKGYIMSKTRQVVTETFLNKIRTDGKLAQALIRLSPDLRKYKRLPRFTNWELICEEILDTEDNPSFYEQIVAELKRRGISDLEMERMRMFAWKTAGWLNYEKMLWEWVRLGNKEIRKAIVWQFKEGEISNEEMLTSLKYLSKCEQNAFTIFLNRLISCISLYWFIASEKINNLIEHPKGIK